jgi:hypothetical protein
LRSPDRVTLLVKVLSNPPQQIDIFWTVIAPAPTALHRLELREFGFPEPQHMRRQFELPYDFADGPKCRGRFCGAERLVSLSHQRPSMP